MENKINVNGNPNFTQLNEEQLLSVTGGNIVSIIVDYIKQLPRRKSILPQIDSSNF